MKTNVVLAFDTTGLQDSIALAVGGDVVGRVLPSGGSQIQSSQLVPAFVDLLASKNLTLKDVDILCTLTGPGSFTGIRIGLAAAQGVQLATKCGIFAPTLLDLLQAIVKGAPKTLAVIDSKRGDFFCLGNDGGHTHPEILSPDQVRDLVDAGWTLMSPTPIDGMPSKTPEKTLAEELIMYYKISQNQGREDGFRELTPFYVRNPEFKTKKSDLPCS